MRDGRTRKLEVEEAVRADAEFQRWRATLVVVAGGPEGTEYAIEKPHVLVGRGPGVDVSLDDAAMSREHAAVEFVDGGFRVRDLNSTNGTRVNGGEVTSADLKHGDRIEVGEHVLQLVLEARPAEPRTYVLPDTDA